MGNTLGTGNDPLHLRIHEAGHAIIGRVLALKCYGVSVVPDFDDASAGRAICITDPWMTIEHWDEMGIEHGWRDEDAAIRAGVLMLMAGCAAEQVILGAAESPFADSEDEYAAITNLSSIMAPKKCNATETGCIVSRSGRHGVIASPSSGSPPRWKPRKMTLQCSPVMAEGVTPNLWELADLVKVLEVWESGQN